MRQRPSFSFGVLAIEMVSITVAVVLGFAVNEWRTSRANEDLANSALMAISSEIRFNEKQVVQRIAYYRDMVSQMDSLRQVRPDGRIGFSDLRGWTGAQPPLLRTASYDAAMSTGAFTFIPFELTNGISTLYASQEYIQLVSRSMVEQFMDPTTISLEKIHVIFGLYIDMTPEVIRMYDEVASRLEADGYGASGLS